MDDIKIIGTRFKEFRKNLNPKHTQTQLAKKLEYSTATISRIEKGETEILPVKLELLAEHFEISFDYLLTGKKHEDKLRSLAFTADVKEFKWVIEFCNLPHAHPHAADIPSCLTERVKWLRMKRGLTQKGLAENLDCVSKDMIYKFETGRQCLTFDVLEQYASFFCASYDFLFLGLDSDVPKRFHDFLFGLEYQQQNTIIKKVGILKKFARPDIFKSICR